LPLVRSHIERAFFNLIANAFEAMPAGEISKGLGLPVERVALTPDDLMAYVTSGAMKLRSFVEPTYGASILEWIRQTYDGHLDFDRATTSVEELTGREPQTLENWVRTNRQTVLSAASFTSS
jgi:NAD(P)H dehydrogenase (quinone)